MNCLLEGLGASAARLASAKLSVEILPNLQASDFAHCFATIVPTNPKAYLGTFLKVAAGRYKKGELTLEDCGFSEFAPVATAADVEKILSAMLPVVQTSGEVVQLLEMFRLNDAEERAMCLLKTPSPPTCYVLFLEMRRLDSRPDLLTHICHLLMAGRARLGYNLAAICKSYFDLTEVRGRFSLNLSPFQLSSLEQSEEAFLKILLCI